MKAKQGIYIVIIWLIGQYALAGSPSYRNLRDVDFENYTYRYADQEFHVKDGRYESADDEVPAESLDVISVKFGQLTQTRHEDAVVLTRYNGGGTGLFDTIHIFKLEKGRPVLVDVIEGGDRAEDGVKSFYIENGSLYITSYDGEQNACSTCFDYEHTTEFKWKNQEFLTVWKSESHRISEAEQEAEEEATEETEEPGVDIAQAGAESGSSPAEVAQEASQLHQRAEELELFLSKLFSSSRANTRSIQPNLNMESALQKLATK